MHIAIIAIEKSKEVILEYMIGGLRSNFSDFLRIETQENGWSGTSGRLMIRNLDQDH